MSAPLFNEYRGKEYQKYWLSSMKYAQQWKRMAFLAELFVQRLQTGRQDGYYLFLAQT